MNLTTRILGILLSGLIFAGLWFVFLPARQNAGFVLPERLADADGEPVYAVTDVTGGETTEVHSANLAVRGEQVYVVWYGGTEEGHRDVALYLSALNGAWTPPVRIMDRAGSEAALNRYIRKVGNPVIHTWPDGAVGLFYVTVSVGGWAASAINYMETPDAGATWSRPVRLVTSPFMNISTLVRNLPVSLDDGTIILPAYHEFMGKFAEALHLSRSQAVLGKYRISHGKHSLQPGIVPVSKSDAVALLRYAGSPPMRLLSSTTADSGQHWARPVRETLANPDAAIALLDLRDGRLLLALNDTEDGRHRLSLAIGSASPNPDWQVVKVVEEEQAAGSDHEFQFSYPSLVMDESGFIHLVYTWNQTRIRHVRFNRRWLQG